jgi:putative phosphoribosyl transferase
MIFHDRKDAGRRLAQALSKYSGRADVIVLALPRGGVPVAAEVAGALSAPLDVFVVRKLGTPGYEELAMGAVASGGVRVLNERVCREMGIARNEIEEATARERRELERREAEYRGERPAPALENKIVILVDDGLATGSTMRAAARAAREHAPARLVIAVPVAPAETCEELRAEADEMVCLSKPGGFRAVGQWYEDFSQTTDEEVRRILERSAEPSAAPAAGSAADPTREIPPADWSKFFDDLSRRHSGWLASVEVIGESVGAQTEVRDLPLLGVVVDAARRGSEITILFGSGLDSPIRHAVPQARRVYLQTTAEGADAAIEIESRSGHRTILTFRAPALPEMVNGLARATGSEAGETS